MIEDAFDDKARHAELGHRGAGGPTRIVRIEIGDPDPVGCETSLRSHDVLVNDTAETITAQNTSVTGCRHRCSRPPWLRWRERQRSMWPVPVVVIDEYLKDPLKVLLVQNQQLVETF